MKLTSIRKSGRLPGRSLIALIGAFALAAVHQYLFYGNPPGISYPLFILLFYAYMFHDQREGLRAKSRGSGLSAKNNVRANDGFSWFLLAVILLLSMTYVLFHNPIYYVLNLLAIPPLIFIHLAYVRGVKAFAWWDIRLVGEALNHLFLRSLRHVPTIARIVKVLTVRKMGTHRKSALAKVLIGLVIALPLMAVVINLLAAADGVFQRIIAEIPTWWGGLVSEDGIARVLWTAIFGVLFFSYLWGFVKPGRSRGTQQTSHEREAKKKGVSIDPIIIATLLVSVNLIYMLFVVVQFSYLFGAWEGVLPDGQTYAEYARSGFAELVAVSLINFAILMVSLLCGNAAGTGRLNRMNAILLYIMVGCSGVMLYSAYMRLILYEEAYGYTYIRFMVHAFMIYLAILLVIAILRIRSKSVPLMKYYIILSLISYVLMNYVGMDKVIAMKNIERFRESGQIDAHYLSTLSTDAMPLLVEFSKREYPEMRPELERRLKELTDSNDRWPSFNLSHYRAVKALEDDSGAFKSGMVYNDF